MQGSEKIWLLCIVYVCGLRSRFAGLPAQPIRKAAYTADPQGCLRSRFAGPAYRRLCMLTVVAGACDAVLLKCGGACNA